MANLPVPTPRTFTVSEIEVATYLNAGVRDLGLFLLNVPAAFVTQSAAQNLALNTWTAISFDQSVFDSYGGHSNSTNNTRYTAQVAGWYMVFGCVSFATTSTSGNRGTAVAKNGTRVQGAAGFGPALSGNPPTLPSPPTIVFLAAGDYVEVYGYSTVAMSPGTNSSSDLDSSMTVVWLHS